MRIAAVILFIGSIIFGQFAFEIFKVAESSMHEIYGAVVMLCSVLLLVGSVIVYALGMLNKTVKGESAAATFEVGEGPRNTEGMAEKAEKRAEFRAAQAEKIAAKIARAKQAKTTSPSGESNSADATSGADPTDEKPRARDAWIQP